MSATECPREPEVLDAIASARWPDRLPPDLASHLSSCAVCSDLATVVSAMHADADAVWQDASPPSAGQVWWRAEMRARQEAVRQASRPIAVAQAAAALLVLALVAGGAWLAWNWSRQEASHAWTGMPAGTIASPLAVPLLIALAALVVIAPVAVYLVLADE
jgi:hypothetical protein